MQVSGLMNINKTAAVTTYGQILNNKHKYVKKTKNLPELNVSQRWRLN
jgi:hypothetical protein